MSRMRVGHGRARPCMVDAGLAHPLVRLQRVSFNFCVAEFRQLTFGSSKNSRSGTGSSRSCFFSSQKYETSASGFLSSIVCRSSEYDLEIPDVELDEEAFEDLFQPARKPQIFSRVNPRPVQELVSSKLIPDEWKPVQEILNRSKKERRLESRTLEFEYAREKALQRRAQKIERQGARKLSLKAAGIATEAKVTDCLAVSNEKEGILIGGADGGEIEQHAFEGVVCTDAHEQDESIGNTERLELSSGNLDRAPFDQEEGRSARDSERAEPRNPRVGLQGSSFEEIAMRVNSDGYEDEPSQRRGRRTNSLDKGLSMSRSVLTEEEKALLKSRTLNFTKISSEKWRPFHTLAASGQVYLVAEILKKGIKIESVDKDGLTALQMAVQCGQKAVARLLVKAGADISVRDKDGSTLLHYAAQIGSDDILKFLIRNEAEVNAVDKDGWTPLHVAVQSGRTDAIRALLNRGADATLQNKDGNTPLDVALSFGNCFGFYEVVKLIKKATLRNIEKSDASEHVEV